MVGINLLGPGAVLIAGIVLWLIGNETFGKVKKKDMWKGIGAVIGVIGLIGLFLIPVDDVRDFIGMDDAEPLTIGGDAGDVTSDTPTEVSMTSCPDTGLTDINARMKDTEASTLAYIATTVYFESDEEFVNGTARTGTTSTLTDLGNFQCGTTYKVHGVTDAQGSSSSSATVVTDATDESVTLEGHRISALQLRVKDLATDNFLSLFPDAGTATNSTAFSSLNTTNVYSSVAAADISVGADGSLDYQISLKTETANQFGGDVETYMCVDVGTDNEWQEPDVAFNGAGLSDVKDSLIAKNPSDSTGAIISAADYCYLLGDGKSIKDTNSVVDFFIKARSGQNPDTTNDDVTISILSSGKYLSSQVEDTIKTGIYTDASTQALVTVTSTDAPQLILNIA